METIMTLDEAIIHCLEIVEDNVTCEECKKNHQQLADWLIELKELKKIQEIVKK